MNLLPRRRTSEDTQAATTVEPEVAISATSGGPKGRPTPKRRDSLPLKGTAAAPRNRKESLAWQKEQAKIEKANAARLGTSAGTSTPQRGSAEFRAALRRGDEAVLPKRDRGPVRLLARDWVDSRRMLSNYLLLLLPLLFLGMQFKYLNLLATLLFLVIVGEWYVAGRKILQLARSRGEQTQESLLGLGFYAGGRAYLPRRWRLPQPNVTLGEEI